MNSDNPITFFKEWANTCFSEANIGDTIVFKSTSEYGGWGNKENIVNIYFLDYGYEKDAHRDLFFKDWVKDEVLTALNCFVWNSDSQWKFEFKIEKWTEYDVDRFRYDSINKRWKYSEDFRKYDKDDPRRYSKEYLDMYPKREDYDSNGVRKSRYICPGNEKFLK